MTTRNFSNGPGIATRSALLLGLYFITLHGHRFIGRWLLGGGRAGVPIPMEEHPLSDEIKTITRALHGKPRELRLLTTIADPFGSRVPEANRVGAILASWELEVRRPAIPIELVQNMEPSEVTAVFARKLGIAYSMQLGAWSRETPPLAFLAAAVALGMLALLIYLWGLDPLLIVLCLIVVVVAFLAFVTKDDHLENSPSAAQGRAFIAWRDAVPTEPRTYAEFALAQVRFQWLCNPHEPNPQAFINPDDPLIQAGGLYSGLGYGPFLAELRQRVATLERNLHPPEKTHPPTA